MNHFNGAPINAHDHLLPVVPPGDGQGGNPQGQGLAGHAPHQGHGGHGPLIGQHGPMGPNQAEGIFGPNPMVQLEVHLSMIKKASDEKHQGLINIIKENKETIKSQAETIRNLTHEVHGHRDLLAQGESAIKDVKKQMTNMEGNMLVFNTDLGRHERGGRAMWAAMEDGFSKLEGHINNLGSRVSKVEAVEGNSAGQLLPFESPGEAIRQARALAEAPDRPRPRPIRSYTMLLAFMGGAILAVLIQALISMLA